METRLLLPVVVISLLADPALAQDNACFCNRSGDNTVTEKVITRTVVIDDCDSEPSCRIHDGGHHPWHPHPWHPHPWHPIWHRPVAPVHNPGKVIDDNTNRQISTAGGAVVNIYNTPTATPTPAPPTPAPPTPANPSPTPPGPNPQPTASPVVPGTNDIVVLNQRVDGLTVWLANLGWLAALLALLIAIGILLLALWALRGSRRETHSSTTHSDDVTADLAARLRQRDGDFERLAEEVALLRRGGANERETLVRTTTEHDHTAAGHVIEDAGVAVAAAAAGATLARGDHPREAARDRFTRDRDLDHVREEMTRLRLELERQRVASTPVHRARHDHASVETAPVVEDLGVVAATTVVETVVPAQPAHHPRTHTTHPAIDETDWSIRHYRVVIDQARTTRHDRAQARHDIIHYSDLMLARYPDDAEAVCYARVNKAEALAEAGHYVTALAECETVIAQHAATTSLDVRAHLAQAHFVKATIHAHRKDVARCITALDEWARLHGKFDHRKVVEDDRFKDILTVTEFQVYLAGKVG